MEKTPLHLIVEDCLPEGMWIRDIVEYGNLLPLLWKERSHYPWVIEGTILKFCDGRKTEVDLCDPDALSKIRTTLETIQRRWS